ncbi:NAD-dependent epimerase/dehydratase family protein [Patescibacteria group bacterium]|nr:NAD-dependent epimerase/dehydratase family protein [Patescibacteria group bacterium]
MKILVTGGAGFIGSHLINQLSREGHSVISVDKLSLSGKKLQKARLRDLVGDVENYTIDITDQKKLGNLFQSNTFDVVYHIAAKPGVRESIENPFIYAHSNYIGTLTVLELAKKYNVQHILIASSSSVYGKNIKVPYSENDRVDEQISVYACSKRSAELLAYTYCHLFNMNITCLRFFTVYGPYGRPDMAPYIFTKNIINRKTIDVFNKGKQQRDFTFISDIIDGCIGLLECKNGFSIVNLGNNKCVELMDFIGTIESILEIKAQKRFLSIQPGDVVKTYADISKAKALCGYSPKVNISDGMEKFISWYKDYHKVK